METAERQVSGPTVGTVETDMFCGRCGYNLHALEVIRDDRLEIPVVRCPECGKFHAAGIATGAGRVWLNRLAANLIAMWVMSLLAGLVVFGLACGGLDAGKIEGFVQYEPRPFHGWRDWHYAPAVAQSPQVAAAMLVGDLLIDAGSCVLGFLAGMSMVVCLAHLKRRWAAVLVVVPVLALAVVAFAYYQDRDYYRADMLGFFGYRFGLELALQCVGVLLGARLGRAVARGVLRVVLSRRLLQYVRVLWEVDGKAVPGIDPNKGARGTGSVS